MKVAESRMNSHVAIFVDYLALAYHEARNVRHLARAGYVDTARYATLISGMPTNRNAAWTSLQTFRSQAARASSARNAEQVFQRRFGLTLEELVALSEDPHWSGTQIGGNRWALIDRTIIELRNAIDKNDKSRTSELLALLPEMRHNTGTLGEKLERLRSVDSTAKR